MSGRPAPSLVLKCPTWDHVEAFYARKVKEGALSARVPFQPAPGDAITLALELPDGLVVAIDAEVEASSPAPDGVKSAVRLRATGLTDSLRERLAGLVAESRRGREGRRSRTSSAPPPLASASEAAEAAPEPPPPQPTDAPVDELVEPAAPPSADDVPAEDREVFRELERELRRMREVAAHEVLDVRWDASVQEIRRAYFGLTRRLHPDVMARYRSPAIHAMAAEVFIQVNRAYDRMREAAVAGGGAIAAGPDLLPHQGWVAAIEDLNDTSGASELPSSATPRPTLAFGTKQDPRQFPQADERSPGLSPVDGSLHRELFDDVGLVTPPVQVALDAGPVAEAPAPGPARPTEEVVAEARERLRAEDWPRSRELLASVLRGDPRNRGVRALYHFASAQALSAAGKPVEARTQLEVALAHDPQLEEARAAVERMRQDNPRRTHNLLRRLFK